jgi:hypothetical protein
MQHCYMPGGWQNYNSPRTGSRNPAGTIQALNRSSSVVCSEDIDDWGSERFTPLVLIETENAGRLDKACPDVLSPGGA